MNLPKVLSYPPKHPYIDRLHGIAATLIERDQPMPKIPCYYDIDWIKRHQQSWDIGHFHFGWEQYSLECIKAVIAAHQETNKPLIVTVHDTRNPHTSDSDADQEYLKVLLASASAVVTLTASAQRHIRDSYRIEAAVIPHGPLLSLVDMEKYRLLPKEERTIYVHVKSGRANLDYRRLMKMAPKIENVTGYRMLFGVTSGSPAHKYADTLGSNVTDFIELQDELSHDELCSKIATATALLLPYRWGSHSGLIELANDLATPSMVYDKGHFIDQNPSFAIACSEDALQQYNNIIAAIQFIQSETIKLPSVKERQSKLNQFLEGYKLIYEGVLRR